MTDDSFLVTTSVRSCVSSRKSELADRIITLTEFLGGSAKVEGDYPAWEYRSSSVLRDKISGVYKELYGKEPVFEAVHAGLECGILSDKIKDLDCVSFGPDNHDIHTPRERLSISSTERVYIMITELLKRLK
jgi:dipeptidase D